MPQNIQNKLLNPLMKLKEPTRICKICFKSYRLDSLRNIVYSRISICHRCFDKLNPKFVKFKLENVSGLSLYEYDDNMKQLIYQFKGCYDIELGSVFFEQYLLFLRYKYFGYILIPMPSSLIDDTRREFNHVVEAFKILNLPIYKLITKTENYKQSDQKKRDRINIKKYLKVSNLELLENKKILLVDDIITTGSTLKSAIELVRKGKPKTIKILTIAKVKTHY